MFIYLDPNLWRAERVITKTKKLTHLTDKLVSYLDKLYRNA